MNMFFIDGSSFIPIENNFWSYFILYQKTSENNYKLLGYSTTVNIHMELHKYRTMLSQFIILPPYQRKNYGYLLLDVNIF